MSPKSKALGEQPDGEPCLDQVSDSPSVVSRLRARLTGVLAGATVAFSALGVSGCAHKTSGTPIVRPPMLTISDAWDKDYEPEVFPPKVPLTPATRCPGKTFNVTLQCDMQEVLKTGNFKWGSYGRLKSVSRRLEGAEDMFVSEPEGCEDGKQIQICLIHFQKGGTTSEILEGIDQLGYRSAEWWELALLGADEREILPTFIEPNITALGSMWKNPYGFDEVLHMQPDEKGQTFKFTELVDKRNKPGPSEPKTVWAPWNHFAAVRKADFPTKKTVPTPGAAPKDENCPGPVYDFRLVCDPEEALRIGGHPNPKKGYQSLVEYNKHSPSVLPDDAITRHPVGCEDGKRGWACMFYFGRDMITPDVHQVMDQMDHRPMKWWELTSLFASRHNLAPVAGLKLTRVPNFMALGSKFKSPRVGSAEYVMHLMHPDNDKKREIDFTIDFGNWPNVKTYWNRIVIFPAIHKQSEPEVPQI